MTAKREAVEPERVDQRIEVGDVRVEAIRVITRRTIRQSKTPHVRGDRAKPCGGQQLECMTKRVYRRAPTVQQQHWRRVRQPTLGNANANSRAKLDEATRHAGDVRGIHLVRA